MLQPVRQLIINGVGLFLIVGIAITANAQIDDASCIQPSEQNPYFWQYQGEPVRLLGGSDDDNLFQFPNLEEHLDLMVEVGGNYIRNTMSSRDEGNVHPFKQLENGKYDLDQWNPEYWNRFESMLKMTAERQIFVQIELWDQWDHNEDRWDRDPWNPDQNVNYTTENTRLKGNGNYSDVRHASGVQHDLFLTVPAVNNDEVVLGYQQKFIDKVLSYALQYDHILYTVTNELFIHHPKEWSQYWAKYVKQKAKETNVNIEITEMFQWTDLTHEQHRTTLDHPELFDYIELSQNSANDGEEHWQHLMWARDYISAHARPINHTKTYGGPAGSWTTSSEEGIERFWRNIIGGAASCRFHRPDSGIGLNEQAQAQLKSARMFLAEFDQFRCMPDVNHGLLSNRDENEAYLTLIPGREYGVYFPKGGSVDLNLSMGEGMMALKWLDLNASEWTHETVVIGGETITLTTPEEGKGWCAVIR